MIRKGRIKVTFDVGDGASRRKLLDDMNSIVWRKKMDREIRNLPICRVDIQHLATENENQTDGYDGYLAIDQVIRSMPHSCKLRSGQGSI